MLQMEADDINSASVAATTTTNYNNNQSTNNQHNNSSSSQSVSTYENLVNARSIKTLITDEVIETVINSTPTTAATIILNNKNVETASPVCSGSLVHACSAPSMQQSNINLVPKQPSTSPTTTINATTPCDLHVHRSYSSAFVTPKMLRKSIDSTASLRRRVSFPKYDNELVTGYLEPANPWQHTLACEHISEVAELYERSCRKHNTIPLSSVQDHLRAIELNKNVRQPMLCLKSIKLAPNDCEALEEIFKRVQYKSIDLSACDLEESAASALFEMIEYYEATNELDISSNAKGMTHRGWVSCTYMISHSRALQVLNAQGNPISKSSAENLGHALSTSNLHTIKLEHCGLKGAPLNGLCLKIRHNRVLKELWLANNDLDCVDADTIADLLKVNHYLELIDISNNNIQDVGMKSIVRALLIQAAEVERKAKARREELEKGKTATFELGDSSIDNDDEDEDDNNTVVEQSFENHETKPVVAVKAESMKHDVDLFETCDNVEMKNTDCDIKLHENSTAIQKQLLQPQTIVGQSMLDKLLSMNSGDNETILADCPTQTIFLQNKIEQSIDNNHELLVDISETINTSGASTLLDLKTVEVDHSSKVQEIMKNNLKQTEEFDDTHSTDSAFESASEGDISKHLSEEYGRLTASVTVDSGIETGLIAMELPENLLLDIEKPTPEAVTSPEHTTGNIVDPVNCYLDTQPLMSVKERQSSDETHTHDADTASDSVEEDVVQQNAPTLSKSKDIDIVSNTNSKKTASIIMTASPISSPASFNSRRTDTCNFITQASRNYSHSTDSLCSENSLDGSITSNDLSYVTNSQLNEKLTKNDTLTRQQRPVGVPSEIYNSNPNGLKALAVWNNNLTKESGFYISDLLEVTDSLELLNIGKNCLSNDFLLRIKEQLILNSTLTTLGLQSAHLSEQGIETLTSILTFGGNNNLQRIDIRDNKLTVESLLKIEEVLKSNTTITQIDIDDEPKRLSVGTDEHQNYTRILQNIRSMCLRNEQQNLTQSINKSSVVQESVRPGARGYNVGSRKISLTCYNRAFIDTCLINNQQAAAAPMDVTKLETKRKSGCRLRSPVPSPSAISPSSSPNRSRFQVFRVAESSTCTVPTNSSVITTESSSIIFRLTPAKLSPLTGVPSTVSLNVTQNSAHKALASSPRTRFQVCRIYEDPKIPLIERSMPPITPPINPPPTPISKNVPRHETEELTSSSSNETIPTIVAEISTHVEREETDVSETSSSPSTCSTSSTNSSFSPPPSVTITQLAENFYDDNDVTLTEKTRDHLKTIVAQVDLLDSDKGNDSDDNLKSAITTTTATSTTEHRTRKTSWIANPATVDKLLNIFQNPAALFQRSNSPEIKETIPTSTSLQAFNTHESALVCTFPVHKTPPWTTESFPVSSHQSSPIPWCSNSTEMAKTLATTAAAATLVQSRSFLDNASRQFKDLGKQVFGTNFPLAADKKLVAAEAPASEENTTELPNTNAQFQEQ